MFLAQRVEVSSQAEVMSLGQSIKAAGNLTIDARDRSFLNQAS